MRTLPGGVQAAADGASVGSISLVEMQTTVPAYFCTAPFTVNSGGHDYLGLGTLVALEPIRETESVEAVGVRVTLSGVPSSLLAVALGEAITGKALKIHAALIGADGAIVGSAFTVFSGRMDTMTISDDGPAATIVVTAESRMAALMSSNVKRMTDADHKQRYTGDDFFEHSGNGERALAFPAAAFFRR